MSASPGLSEKQWRILILGLSLPLYVVVLFLGFFMGFDDQLKRWDGYYTLLVSSDVPLGDLEAKLDGAGFSGYLSADRAKVEVSVFKGLEYRPLAGALSEGDPRTDDWIRRAASLFEDEKGAFRIVYLPSEESVAALMVRLGAVFRDLSGSYAASTWQLVEWRPLERLILMAASLLSAALVFWTAKGRRVFIGFSGLVWIPLAAAGGPVLFPLQVAILFMWASLSEILVPGLKRYAHEVAKAPFLWDYLAEKKKLADVFRDILPFFDRRPLKVRFNLFVLSLLLAAGFSLLKGSWGLLGSLVLVEIGAWSVLLIFLSRFLQVRHRRSEHRLFSPVPILTKGSILYSRLRPVVPFLLLVSLGLGCYFFLLPGGASGAKIPGFSGEYFGPLNYANVEKMYEARSGRQLPDLADYVKHRAFQEALPFLQEPEKLAFEFPALGTELGLTRYKIENSGVKVWVEEKVRFDDAWLSEVFSGADRLSPEAMLLAQGGLYGLEFVSLGALYSADIWALVSQALLVLFLTTVWLLGRDASVTQIYGSRRLALGNRKLAA